MKPEHWQQLDKLFHSALECELGERAAFLEQACAGDESLRKQVEALLAAHEEAGSFIEPDNINTAIYPFEGGEPHKILDIASYYFRWTPDGRALAYVDERNFSTINSQTTDGGPPKQFADFKPDRIFSFAWSRDGNQLAVAPGTLTHDVILISNFKDQR